MVSEIRYLSTHFHPVLHTTYQTRDVEPIMLAHRLRCCANTEPTFVQHLVFAGYNDKIKRGDVCLVNINTLDGAVHARRTTTWKCARDQQDNVCQRWLRAGPTPVALFQH